MCQEDFTLPDPFGPTYDTFLALQQEAGFDLTPYAGKTVLRYTYRIANYPAGSDTIYADLLLWQEQVIGGDLRSASLDGFLDQPERVRKKLTLRRCGASAMDCFG